MKRLKWVMSRFLFRLKCKVWFVLRSCFLLHNFELAVSSLPGFWCFFTERIPCGDTGSWSRRIAVREVLCLFPWCIIDAVHNGKKSCASQSLSFLHTFSPFFCGLWFSLSLHFHVSLSHHLSVMIEQNSDYVDWLPLSRSELATPHSMCSWKSNWNDRKRNLLNRNWKKCTQIFIGWNLQLHH